MKVSSAIKTFFACIMLVIVAFIFAGVSATPEDTSGFNEAAKKVAIVLAVSSFALFYSAAKSPKSKKNQTITHPYLSYLTQEELQTIQDGNLPEITDVPVILGTGEVAHYFAPARRYITKTKAVGRTGGRGGVSVRVAKGVTVHTGRSAGQTIYDDVTDTFNGSIVLTNRRLIFVAERNGFDVKLSSISAIVPGTLIMIQSGSKSFMMEIAQPEYFVVAASIALDMAINSKNLTGTTSRP